mmetsp:Transcript_16331/g.37462  ORF Transcript_16331/g.37462 Transcript_16331/m.37462 type:complete len:91 (-) Transcript_16331:162-434(-)
MPDHLESEVGGETKCQSVPLNGSKTRRVDGPQIPIQDAAIPGEVVDLPPGAGPAASERNLALNRIGRMLPQRGRDRISIDDDKRQMILPP